MNDLSIRFKEVFDHLISINKVTGYKDFALKIGVSTSMITEIFKGRSNVGTTALQNVVIQFEVNGNWLFTGQGEMMLHQAPQLSPPIEPGCAPNESILYKIYKEKDAEVGTLKEEIGRLKEQLYILQTQKRPLNISQH